MIGSIETALWRPRVWSIGGFLQKLFKVVCAALLLLTLLAAAENNWFGYAWRSVQLIVQGDDVGSGIGNAPDAVLTGTPLNDDGSITILAVGDIVSCPRPEGIKKELTTLASWAGLDDPLDPSKVAAVRTVALAQKWPDAPVLALGDVVYTRGSPHEFADCFHPIWGNLSPRTLPAPGNHEYRTPGAYAYYDYWGKQAGPERRGYYSVKTDDWLILSLNSEIKAGPNSAQGRWLADELASWPESCVLAFYHRPAYSSQHRDKRGSELQLFEQLSGAGASIILNGHNHLYERTHPMNGNGDVVHDNGTVSFVVGTGGRDPRRKMDLASFIAKAELGRQGLLRLDLRTGEYSWAFHDAKSGKVLDEGSRACASI